MSGDEIVKYHEQIACNYVPEYSWFLCWLRRIECEFVFMWGYAMSLTCREFMDMARAWLADDNADKSDATVGPMGIRNSPKSDVHPQVRQVLECLQEATERVGGWWLVGDSDWEHCLEKCEE
jgi:hypothetical protein